MSVGTGTNTTSSGLFQYWMLPSSRSTGNRWAPAALTRAWPASTPAVAIWISGPVSSAVVTACWKVMRRGAWAAAGATTVATARNVGRK